MSTYPFIGFAAGTPLLTPDGFKSIEDIVTVHRRMKTGAAETGASC